MKSAERTANLVPGLTGHLRVPTWLMLVSHFFATMIVPAAVLAADANLEDIAELSRRVNLRIQCEHEHFPVKNHWGKIRGGNPNSEELAKYAPTFLAELSIYPKDVIDTMRLKRIVLCKNLSFGGQRRYAIPDYDHNILFLDVTAVAHGTGYAREAFQHEIFHIVDYKDDGQVYNDPEWANLNSSSFQYGRGGKYVQDEPFVGALDPNLPGFLTNYSRSGVEEDKAEIFTYMVTHYEMVQRRAVDDPVLKAKMEKMKSLLQQFCPAFNDSFWFSVALKNVSDRLIYPPVMYFSNSSSDEFSHSK